MDKATFEFLGELEREHNGEKIRPEDERQLPCPICKNVMHVEVEHGIQLDVCSEHGFWLDKNELGNMIDRVRSGERVSRLRAVKQAKRDGKTAALLLGVSSLMYD